MGTEQNIIVAFEFGSSAICGIAGQKKPDGTVKVLGLEIEKAPGSVQRGVIYNIDTTTTAIKNIATRLGDKLKVRVTKAYVGISGQSLHTERNVITRKFDTKVKVTAELTDNLNDNNRSTQYKDSDILDVVPQEYVMGHHREVDPIGVQTEGIEAHYVNIVARRVLSDNIKQCMKKAGVGIVETFISPIALADALLGDNDKRSGCALVDFGAETTTVSVYTSNILRSLVVIPLGGNNITADLVNGKQLFRDEAENMKRKYGIAYVATETDKPQSIPISNNRTIDENELLSIIGARQEEIIANIWEQVKDRSRNLLAGIITTGGAAQIKDMTEAIKHHTGFDRVKAAKSLITSVEVSHGVNTPRDVNLDTLIALLMCGTDSCVEETKETPPTPPSGTGKETTPPEVSTDDEVDDEIEEDDDEEGEKKSWWRILTGAILNEEDDE